MKNTLSAEELLEILSDFPQNVGKLSFVNNGKITYVFSYDGRFFCVKKTKKINLTFSVDLKKLVTIISNLDPEDEIKLSSSRNCVSIAFKKTKIDIPEYDIPVTFLSIVEEIKNATSFDIEDYDSLLSYLSLSIGTVAKTGSGIFDCIRSSGGGVILTTTGSVAQKISTGFKIPKFTVNSQLYTKYLKSLVFDKIRITDKWVFFHNSSNGMFCGTMKIPHKYPDAGILGAFSGLDGNGGLRFSIPEEASKEIKELVQLNKGSGNLISCEFSKNNMSATAHTSIGIVSKQIQVKCNFAGSYKIDFSIVPYESGDGTTLKIYDNMIYVKIGNSEKLIAIQG